MVEQETSGSYTFDLPDEVLQVLPSDPFQQLDIARKITSIALSTRVASLESESSSLRALVGEKDELLSQLQSQLDSLDASLSDTSDKLARAELHKEKLLKENAMLSNTVRKLQRDVSKLEVFRKTLMQSLQEDTEETSAGVQPIIAKPTPSEDDAALQPPSRTSSMRSQNFEVGNYLTEDRDADSSRSGLSSVILLASQTSTPRLTPPSSPPLSASGSPTRRHSMAFSTFDKSSLFSSLPSSQYSPVSNVDSGSIPGRTRVDGKEFFRQVRSRLSYEQFGAFLANVKELNLHKLTKEEALKKADEIFGPDNRDLYTIFEGLITRSVAH